MKRVSIFFMVTGIVFMIVGCLIWPHLNASNAVDSDSGTVYINGIKSFRWPVFTGGIFFLIGLFTTTVWNVPPGRRYS